MFYFTNAIMWEEKVFFKGANMSMKANIIVDGFGNIMVQMQGDICVDTTINFREEINGLVHRNPTATVAIDMSALEFVGSSGISHFVETLKLLRTKRSSAITLKNVDPDFEKVFKLYGLNAEHVFIDNFGMNDDETSTLNITWGNRSKTFEN